jgi:hypothetical protein
MATILCSQCGKELTGPGSQAPVASISGSIMGDEYTESYYYCDTCKMYTVEVCHDRFLGEESSATRGPVSKLDGDIKVALIRRCSRPWDKKCRCDAHVEYFGGSLD